MKLGRTPAKYDRVSFQRSHILARHLAALGPAPAVSPDWITPTMNQMPSWGMYGNDTYGDCVIADCAHQELLRTANVGKVWIPENNMVTVLYAMFQGMQIDPNADPTSWDMQAVTDYLAANDNGCNELDVITYLHNTGWRGRKLDGSANLDPTQLDHLKWAVCIFGASRLGVNLPQSAMNQFNAGQPWDYSDDPAPIGGHDIPLVRYTGDMYFVVTWGKLHPATQDFMYATYPDGTPYIEEAHAELAFDWVNAIGSAPNKLKMNQLVADLNAVTG